MTKCQGLSSVRYFRKPTAALICLPAAFCAAVWCGINDAAAKGGVPRVLILYPYDNILPATTLAGEAARKRLLERSDDKVEIYIDFLDLVRFPNEAHGQRLARHLSEKYSQTALDIIITLNTESQRFAMKYRDVIAPGVPVVFCCVQRGVLSAMTERPADVTGVVSDYDLSKTIDLALRLQPETRNLVYVGGASEVDQRWSDMYLRQLSHYEGRYNVSYLVGLPMGELLEKVSMLPRNSVILLGTIFVDGVGQHFVPLEAAEAVANAASAPAFGAVEPFLGHGIVGGYMGTFQDAGIEVADLALEILGGKDPRSIPPRSSEAQFYRADARQLQRWNFSESRLPDGTLVINKEKSLWEQHRDVIVAIAVVIVLQAILISALLLQMLRRQRVEISLRESEGRWRSLFDTSTVGIALADHNMNYLAANSAFQQMVGYGAEDLKHLSHLDITLDENRESSRQARRELEEGRRRHHEAILRYRRKDGAPIWVQEYISTIDDDDGKPRFYVETAIDITDRKRAERAMEAAKSELARVTRVTTMGEMTASIAHEVNQPLAAIVASSNAGLRWLSHASPNIDEAKVAFKRIVSDGHRAGEVLAAVRAMFKKDGMARALVDLNQLTQEVLALVQSELRENGVLFEQDMTENVPKLIADRVQLQQVILNLVRNAIEAMAGVVERERLLRISIKLDGSSEVVVKVEDTGPGLGTDDLERIFEAFYTTKPHGMGMGLSICRSIVESHGGRLSVSRGNPFGAIFTVALPARVGEA